jgi:hypothetical protein
LWVWFHSGWENYWPYGWQNKNLRACCDKL